MLTYVKTYIANIKRAVGTRKLLLSMVLLYLAHGFLQRTFGLPVYWSYILEFCSLLVWFRKPFRTQKTKTQFLYHLFGVLIVFDLVCDILHFVNPMNVLMGIRGNFLPMALFFAAGAYLTVDDYRLIFKLLYKFQWLNVLCTFIQWKVYGYVSDFNNGALTGGAEQNFFCTALIVYYIFAYSQKLVSAKQLAFVLASSFFIAIIQDEKFIFVGTMLCGIVFFLSQKMRPRNVLGAVALMAAFVIAVGSLDEGQSEVMGSVDGAMQYSQKAGAGYGFPRIGSAAMISDMFFHDNFQTLTGLGLGTCTEMRAPGADLSFSSQYGGLAYYLFMFQDVFLETGWVGTILFVSFFVSLVIYNARKSRSAPPEYKWMYGVATTLSLVAVVIIWYNCTLRIYYAVLPYILLGLGPCLTKTLNSQK